METMDTLLEISISELKVGATVASTPASNAVLQFYLLSSHLSTEAGGTSSGSRRPMLCRIIKVEMAITKTMSIYDEMCTIPGTPMRCTV